MFSFIFGAYINVHNLQEYASLFLLLATPLVRKLLLVDAHVN